MRNKSLRLLRSLCFKKHCYELKRQNSPKCLEMGRKYGKPAKKWAKSSTIQQKYIRIFRTKCILSANIINICTVIRNPRVIRDGATSLVAAFPKGLKPSDHRFTTMTILFVHATIRSKSQLPCLTLHRRQLSCISRRYTLCPKNPDIFSLDFTRIFLLFFHFSCPFLNILRLF